MNKLLAIIILILGASTAFTQTSSADIEKMVEAFVTDTSSNQYWEKTYERFRASEEEITNEEYLRFYYSNGVKAIKTRPFPSLYLNQNRLKMFDNAKRNKLKKVKEYSLELIEVNPFDIGTLVYLSMALDKLENDTDNRYYARMKRMVEVIFSTGDGQTPETAIKIAETDDDELLIGFTGFNGRKLPRQEINGNMYSIWENRFGEKMYFEYVFIFF